MARTPSRPARSTSGDSLSLLPVLSRDSQLAGEIKALVGGRNYGASQLNRVLARRPPGSVFKPFVYTAAMNTAIAVRNTRRAP